MQVEKDWWSLFVGSREDKAKAVAKYTDFLGQYPGAQKTFQTAYIKAVDTTKAASAANAAYWGQTVLLNTNIQTPKQLADLKDIILPSFDWQSLLKWLLIGGLAIGGFWIITKYIGGKK